jgi:hypothetical protein
VSPELEKVSPLARASARIAISASPLSLEVKEEDLEMAGSVLAENGVWHWDF